MKVVITGTHFTPAQAVIEEFKKNPEINVVYIGRRFTREGDKNLSVESQVLLKLGVKFISLIAGRLQRSFTLYTIPSLLKIPIGFIQAFYLVLKEKPDVVLSFGGYIAVPVVISAWLLSIPIIIHEQTLVSGLANQISAFFANKIAVSFSENKSFNKNRTILTGNPIRRELISTDEKLINTDIQKIINLAKRERLPIVLVTGGNQGSHIINESIEKILDELTKQACVVHQTGDSKFKDYENLIQKQFTLKNPERFIVKKWISGSDWGHILKNINLVVTRGGINTLLELAYFRIPALVVPIPYVYKNEQVVNAKFFESIGLAKILLQKNLSAQTLAEDINQMIKNLTELKEKAKESKDVVILDAAKRLALETLLLARNG